MAEDAVQYPVFIVGSARSGTSVVAAVFHQALGIPGSREGHYFSQLAGIHRAVSRHYDSRREAQGKPGIVTLADIPFESVWGAILADFKRLHDARIGGARIWFDKTPDFHMVQSIPFVREIYPEARFLFLKRRGFENVVSRRKKFPHLSFERQCTLWSKAMSAWAATRQRLPLGTWLEIDQRDVALAPGEVADAIATILQLPEHDREVIRRYLRDNRPQYTGGDESRPLDFGSLDWSEGQKETFVAVCDEMMQLFGYTYDERYRALPGRQAPGGGSPGGS